MTLPRHDIQAFPRPDYLYVEVSGRGQNSVDWVVAVWSDIALIAQNHKARRLMVVDRRECATLTYPEYEEAVHRMLALGHEPVKTAYVEMSLQAVSQVEYGAIVAMGRGYPFRMFTETNAALAWLLQPGQ